MSYVTRVTSLERNAKATAYVPSEAEVTAAVDRMLARSFRTWRAEVEGMIRDRFPGYPIELTEELGTLLGDAELWAPKWVNAEHNILRPGMDTPAQARIDEAVYDAWYRQSGRCIPTSAEIELEAEDTVRKVQRGLDSLAERLGLS